MPEGYVLKESEDVPAMAEADPDRSALADEQQRFWMEFLPYLKLDDPEQPMPRAARKSWISLTLPAPTSWLTVYRGSQCGELGVFLSSWRNTPGGYAMEAIAADWDTVKGELGGTAKLIEKDGRPRIIDSLTVGRLDQAEMRAKGFAWLAERVNTFVNVLRPRIRSAAAEYPSQGRVGNSKRRNDCHRGSGLPVRW